jgi:hypothetical protein
MTRGEALGVWGRAPRTLTATPRRRRLALVGASAPGVLTGVLGTHLWHDPRWLGSGVALLLAALLARHLSEPRFLAWEMAASAPAPHAEEPGHEP